jgi:anti-sigma28 factor (negative regulator of flagellin synthesis)
MRIDPAGYEEIRKVQRTDQKREERRVNEKGGDEQDVIQENTRAVSLALGDKEFRTNVEKVERLKREIESGEYKPNSETISKRLMQSETRGDLNLGLTSG